jgi:hypothetical protein
MSGNSDGIMRTSPKQLRIRGDQKAALCAQQTSELKRSNLPTAEAARALVDITFAVTSEPSWAADAQTRGAEFSNALDQPHSPCTFQRLPWFAGAILIE